MEDISTYPCFLISIGIVLGVDSFSPKKETAKFIITGFRHVHVPRTEHPVLCLKQILVFLVW